MNKKLFTAVALLVFALASVMVPASASALISDIGSLAERTEATTHVLDKLKQQPGKFVEVTLSEQRLDAWEDGRIVMTTPVSTGVRQAPTPTGTFRIMRKYERQRMTGPDYDLPNVPYVMYFRAGGFALHGTYWHNNFGQPMSHGCVNLPTSTAVWLYQWAPTGTSVVVH